MIIKMEVIDWWLFYAQRQIIMHIQAGNKFSKRYQKNKKKLHKNEGGVGKPEQLRLTATGNVGEVGKDEIFIIFVTATIINLHEIVFHVQESWHYTKRQPTVVHGKTFCIIA